MRSSSGLIVVATSKPLSRVWDVRFWGGRDVVAVPPRPSGTLTGRVPMARLALGSVECQHRFGRRDDHGTALPESGRTGPQQRRTTSAMAPCGVRDSTSV